MDEKNQNQQRQKKALEEKKEIDEIRKPVMEEINALKTRIHMELTAEPKTYLFVPKRKISQRNPSEIKH